MTLTKTYVFLLLFPYALSIEIDIRYPQFFHQSSIDNTTVEITEGKTTGSFIAFINLIDKQNIVLNEWMVNQTEQDFKIYSNGLSYSLITNDILDRERKDFYNFSIYAQHLISPFEIVSKSVRIRIIDINDCTPTFNQSIYKIQFIENQTNYTVQAYDCDEINNDNSRISYSLSNYQDLFHINETTGLINVRKRLNNNERYELIVVARDHGKPSLSSTTLVQIQVQMDNISKQTLLSSSSWLSFDQYSQKMFLLAAILSSFFIFLCLFLCLLYRIKRHKSNKDKKYCSTSTINSSNDIQQTTVYDDMNSYPNQFYFPIKKDKDRMENINNSNNNDLSLHISQTSSTTDIPNKIGSDDGCYCSSDMSSEQSNHVLLLNPSSLTTSKHVRFNDNTDHNNIDGVLKRFENLYSTQSMTDHCASYV